MLYSLDLIGVVVFAFSGALVAREKRYDLFGGLVLAIATAIGGGTLRDLCLGRTPLFWTQDEWYLTLAALTASASLLAFRYWPRTNYVSPHWLHVLLVADAIGLAVFTAIGTLTAVQAGLSAPMAAVMGVMTGCFGGVLRDVLAAKEPLIFQRDIYATAALLGALSWLLIEPISSVAHATAGAIAVTAGLRLIAIWRNWHLPTYQNQQ